MKLKHRVLALILTLMMVLTYMPVMAFAAAEGAEPSNASVKPKKVEFVLGDPEKPAIGFIGSTYADIWEVGNKAIITYSDKSTKTYICAEDSDGELDFYLNGKTSSKVLEIYAYTEEPIREGDNVGFVNAVISSVDLFTKINIVGIVDSEVSSVSYNQTKEINVAWNKLITDPYDWMYADKYFKGNELTVKDAEGTATYTYQTDPWDEDSYIYCYYDYDPEYDETVAVEADVDLVPVIDCEKWLPGKTYDVDVYYRGVKADAPLKVNVTSTVAVPNEVIFTPAEGFVPKWYIGEKELWIEPFAWEDAEGSSFTVKYSDGSEKTYIYGKHPKYGYGCYFLDGDTGKAEFGCDATVKGGLVRGSNEVVFTYEQYIKKFDEYALVEFPVTVEADQYAVYVSDKSYKYTGKEITPKFVVKNSVGKTLVEGTAPTETEAATGDYYVSYTPQKDIGIYTAQIIFNNGLEDRDLYPDSEEGIYRIAPPKKPVITSVKGGSKRLTVKWKKFSAAQRKLIDGFYIEVATDKNFYNNYKCIKVSKTASSKTIKSLKKNKKYYVRMCAYKNVLPEGSSYKYPVYSADSKRKSAKTK